MVSELKPCPFCSKTMMLRSALWPSEGDADAIIHADPTDCPMLGFSDGSADGSIIEKWNCSLSNEDDFPSDGSCVRCGSVPRNANGLCNTCLDEDAERLENTRTTPVAPVSPDTDGKCGELVTEKEAFADAFPQPSRKVGGDPCGECRLQPGETCDICGANADHADDLTVDCFAIAIETVEYQFKPGGNDYWANTTAHNLPGYKAKGWQTRELVTRSQAEELLAAERAEKDGWKELHDAAQVAVKERTEACNNLYKQVNDLKADNAAKDARINFLERVTKDQETQITAQEVLEAKLASAEKAMEAARPYVEDYDTRRHNTGVDETLTQIDAVLGGKPS
ncbi:hypothetical protein Brsp07_01089 [Brucella sp. NBRC 14130]|uniref:hypothetical protein n=1 Tax=Brucella sp. NBRC 14130 TaxID=3075483 RepID=UPI00309E7FF1